MFLTIDFCIHCAGHLVAILIRRLKFFILCNFFIISSSGFFPFSLPCAFNYSLVSLVGLMFCFSYLFSFSLSLFFCYCCFMGDFLDYPDLLIEYFCFLFSFSYSLYHFSHILFLYFAYSLVYLENTESVQHTLVCLSSD